MKTPASARSAQQKGEIKSYMEAIRKHSQKAKAVGTPSIRSQRTGSSTAVVPKRRQRVVVPVVTGATIASQWLNSKINDWVENVPPLDDMVAPIRAVVQVERAISREIGNILNPLIPKPPEGSGSNLEIRWTADGYRWVWVDGTWHQIE